MQAVTVEIKSANGHLSVLALGRTGRGQRYIKAVKGMGATSMHDKNFKTEMAGAVKELLGSEA